MSETDSRFGLVGEIASAGGVTNYLGLAIVGFGVLLLCLLPVLVGLKAAFASFGGRDLVHAGSYLLGTAVIVVSGLYATPVVRKERLSVGYGGAFMLVLGGIAVGFFMISWGLGF